MSALRTIFGPALLAMGLVAGIAYLFSLGDKEDDLGEPEPAPARPAARAVAPEPVAPPAAPAEPVAPPPEVAPPSAANPAPVRTPPVINTPLATKSLPDPTIPSATPPPPLEPRLRTHAMQMVAPALKMALERGDLKQLRTVRAFIEQRKQEHLLPDVDVQALDAAIGCLEQAPDARQEATDFLKFGEKSQFADGLRKACF